MEQLRVVLLARQVAVAPQVRAYTIRPITAEIGARLCPLTRKQALRRRFQRTVPVELTQAQRAR